MNTIPNHLQRGRRSNDNGLELEELRKEYGHLLPAEWHGHPYEKLRLGAIAKRVKQGLSPSEPVPTVEQKVFVPLTIQSAAAHYGWATLDQLTTTHMTADLAKSFAAILTAVRQWRDIADGRAKACVLASPSVGMGKTHIAKSVAASYHSFWCAGVVEAGFVNGRPNFHMMSQSISLTSAQLMERMDADDYTLTSLVPAQIRCVVIDDIGREGAIKFTPRNPEAQREERQNRYFELINYLYERGNCDLFITTNMTAAQLATHFNEPTMSRLAEMSRGRYIIDIRSKFPDMRVLRAKGMVV